MGSVDPGPFNVKRVAVIGAGPCGLSAAKYLVAQQTFEIVVYEQNPEVGGVWMYSREPSDKLHVPQTSAFCPPDPPVKLDDAHPPVFASPMYELLHTNIPWTIMKYGDLDFPKESLIFPSRQVVQDYLVEYSQEVRHLISFSTQVKAVNLKRGGNQDKWDIETENLIDGQKSKATFDAVVVASGHYSTTFIPDVKNIKAFHAAHPGVLTHAKMYRAPEDFANKKVLVVGNASSGLDIATQISRHCKGPLLLSVHEPTPEENLDHVRAEEVPAIEEYLVEENGVRFADGRVEKDFDAIVYCTGWTEGVWALQTPVPHRSPDLDISRLAHPGRALPCLGGTGSRFCWSLVERHISAINKGDVQEMSRWEEEEYERRGKGFHVFPKLGDSELLDEFHDWAKKSSSGKGKEPPVWSDDQKWQRTTYVEAKLKFEVTGRKAKSLAELGFVYQPPSEVNKQDIV